MNRRDDPDQAMLVLPDATLLGTLVMRGGTIAECSRPFRRRPARSISTATI